MDAGPREAGEEGGYKVDVTSFTKKEDEISFNVKGMDPSILNAFRRTIISGIPSLAIEKVRFHQNNSILNDEVLAHRIGLVPLKAGKKKVETLQKCKCEGMGCEKCTVTFTLEGRGPKTIYSKDLVSSDPDVKPVYESIPLIKLTENQEVKLEADAIPGYGKNHMKWQAGLAGYEVKKNHVEFKAETYGQYSIEEMTIEALEKFHDKIKEVQASIK